MTYPQWLMVANLILYLECYPLEDDFRCSCCGHGVPVCSDLPGGYKVWHHVACGDFDPSMPICWRCEREFM